ncbi:MAG: L-lactate permease [Desulfobacteraceae bacterium]|nr:MAG: L-lactate permease [Desulfobacteraceae bacterium]
MDTLLFLAAASPVLLIAVLVIGWKMPALGLSVWGILFTAVLSVLVFHTSLTTILLGALDGIITTLPLLLTIFFGIILSVLLIGTGALARIVNGLAKGFRNPMHQVNGICFGIENFVAGAGIITEPIIAPTLKAAGLPGKDAAILASWGYAGIMSFTLAGVFVVILASVTGLDLQRLAVITAIISLMPTLVCGCFLPLVMEKKEMTKGHFFFNICTAFACGIMTLFFVFYVSSSTACMLAGLGVLGGIILISRSMPDFSAIRFADIAPFLILIVGLSLVNLYRPLRTIASEKLVFSLSIVPLHLVKIRPLMDAYTYLIMAILITIWGLKITRSQVAIMVKTAMPRVLRAITAMMIFGALGQVIAFTGYEVHSGTMVAAHNIPWVLASGLSKLSGKYYPVFAPLLGWTGTFLTGYGSLSVMIFGKLQVEIARFIHLSPEVLASAMMVGSGIGSVSSPFKVAMATSLVDAVGKEGEILRKMIPIGIALALITGIWSYALIHILS